MRILPFLLCTLLAFSCHHAQAAAELETLSKSPVWQVRYSVALKYDEASDEARRVLETLSIDEERSVARQAFAAYSRIFVVLDREIVKKSFARGDFDLVGVSVQDRKIFENPEFWIHQLDSSDNPTLRARAIRVLGMCGKNADASKLSGHLNSTNSHLLIELALAFHRLGDEKQYSKAIETILALPFKESLSYQTYAIDCLIQTHPDRAQAAWMEVQKQFQRTKEGQPNWVYAHITQEARLP